MSKGLVKSRFPAGRFYKMIRSVSENRRQNIIIKEESKVQGGGNELSQGNKSSNWRSLGSKLDRVTPARRIPRLISISEPVARRRNCWEDD